jgi:hypothetical protein
VEGCVPHILTLSHSFPTQFLSFLFLSLPLHPLSSPRSYSRPQRSSSVSSDPLFPCCQSSVTGTSRFGIRSHARRYSDLAIPSSLKLLARAHCGDLAHQRAHHSTGRGRNPPNRDDDIPPAPPAEVQHQQQCLLELQRHLLCQEHSKLERTPTYCWVESATATSIGGHRQVTHSEMTLWAKNIVSKILCVMIYRNSRNVVPWHGHKDSSTKYTQKRSPSFQED